MRTAESPRCYSATEPERRSQICAVMVWRACRDRDAFANAAYGNLELVKFTFGGAADALSIGFTRRSSSRYRRNNATA